MKAGVVVSVSDATVFSVFSEDFSRSMALSSEFLGEGAGSKSISVFPVEKFRF